MVAFHRSRNSTVCPAQRLWTRVGACSGNILDRRRSVRLGRCLRTQMTKEASVRVRVRGRTGTRRRTQRREGGAFLTARHNRSWPANGPHEYISVGDVDVPTTTTTRHRPFLYRYPRVAQMDGDVSSEAMVTTTGVAKPWRPIGGRSRKRSAFYERSADGGEKGLR